MLLLQLEVVVVAYRGAKPGVDRSAPGRAEVYLERSGKYGRWDGVRMRSWYDKLYTGATVNRKPVRLREESRVTSTTLATRFNSAAAI